MAKVLCGRTGIIFTLLWFGGIHVVDSRSPSATKILNAGTTTLWTASTYNYNSVLDLNGRKSFIFSLKACSDGHLALQHRQTEHDKNNDTALVIGAWDNSQTYIHKGGVNYGWASTPNVLHCSEYRTFWIAWKYGIVEVGQGSVIDHHKIALTSSNTNAPGDVGHDIISIGFSTGYGWSGVWEIEENQGVYLSTYTPDDFRYEYIWKTVEKREGFYPFKVKANHDVHIALATTQGVPVYEVYIGGFTNTRSCIRHYRGDDLSCEDTVDIVDPDKFRNFWISWIDGHIHVGRGEFLHQGGFLNHTVSNFPGINALSFSAGYGSDANWYFFEEWSSHTTFHTVPKEEGGSVHGAIGSFIFTPREDRLTLRVHGTDNAVLALCGDPKTDDPDFTYYIHIGVEDNTKVQLHIPYSGEVIEVQTGAVLDPGQSKPIWVSWAGTFIKFGTGSHFTNPILEYDIGMQHFVNTVGLGNAGNDPYMYWYLINNEGDGVSALTPPEHNFYRQMWITVSSQFYKVFRVMACKNAHVILSERNGGIFPAYEVIVGLDNQFTVIKDRVGGEHHDASADTPDILHCNEFRTFWVSWLSRLLRVGHGHKYNYHEIVRLETIMPHVVNAISVTTDGTEGDWEWEKDMGSFFWARSTTPVNSNKWIQLKPTIKWMFFGAAGGTARLTLASKYRDHVKSYQIAIGANGNTQTTFSKDGNVVQTRDTANIMSTHEMRDFWVSWEDGISFGQGRYRDREIVFKDSDRSYEVTAVEFSAEAANTEVEWEFDADNAIELTFDSHGSSTRQLWLDVSDIGHLVFGVQACHSADLFLTAVPHSHESDHSYRVAIQTESSHTYISKGSGSRLAERHTPGVLSCNEEQYFWLTWQAGTVALGSGRAHGFNTIISYHDLDFFRVTALSLSTYNTTGIWRVPLSDEDFQYLENNPSSGGLTGGEIAGVVIGMIALFALFALIIYLVFKPPQFMEPLVKPCGSSTGATTGNSGNAGVGSTTSTSPTQGDFAPGFDRPVVMEGYDQLEERGGASGGASENNAPAAAGFTSATSSDVKDSGISFENPLNQD